MVPPPPRRRPRPLRLLCGAALGGALLGAEARLLQTPEEAMKLAAEHYAGIGLKELTALANEKAAEQEKTLPGSIEAARASLGMATEGQVGAAKSEVAAEKQREGELVAKMRAAIVQAHALAVAEAEKAGDEWARKRAHIDVFAATKAELDQSIKENAGAETARQDAVSTLEAAGQIAAEMVELSHEAETVAKQLLDSEPEKSSETFAEHNALLLSQAQSARRLSNLASQTVKAADAIATESLARSKEALKNAEQAFSNARTNAANLQKLKLRAQTALQDASHQLGHH